MRPDRSVRTMRTLVYAGYTLCISGAMAFVPSALPSTGSRTLVPGLSLGSPLPCHPTIFLRNRPGRLSALKMLGVGQSPTRKVMGEELRMGDIEFELRGSGKWESGRPEEGWEVGRTDICGKTPQIIQGGMGVQVRCCVECSPVLRQVCMFFFNLRLDL